MYRRIDKGMKKTIAIAAATVVSFALLAGCGSKADPPAKSPSNSSSPSTPPTTEPATPQEEQAAVAKAASGLYVNLAAGAAAFDKSKQPFTYATFDKVFSKSFAVVDLPSFKTKKHAYAVVYLEGSFANTNPSKSPETSVEDLYTIKDVSEIKIIGDKATFKTTAFPGLSDLEPVEQVTFNKVDGKWLLDGAKYADAYFKAMGLDANEFPIK